MSTTKTRDYVLPLTEETIMRLEAFTAARNGAKGISADVAIQKGIQYQLDRYPSLAETYVKCLKRKSS